VRLRAAKARGVKLGTPANLRTEAAAKGRELGLQVSQERARKFAERMSGQVERLRREGLSLRDIARQLNEEGALTASGKVGGWTADGVRRVLNA
jgi:hypothetical protein